MLKYSILRSITRMLCDGGKRQEERGQHRGNDEKGKRALYDEVNQLLQSSLLILHAVPRLATAHFSLYPL